YEGKTIKVRFRGITGSGFESDIALDDIKLVDQNTISTTEFESLTDGITIYGEDHLVIQSHKESIRDIVVRSEERRVGKECRCHRSEYYQKINHEYYEYIAII